MNIIPTLEIDNSIAWTDTGERFIKVWQNLDYSLEDISASIENYFDNPMLVGEREQLILDQAIEYLTTIKENKKNDNIRI